MHRISLPPFLAAGVAALLFGCGGGAEQRHLFEAADTTAEMALSEPKRARYPLDFGATPPMDGLEEDSAEPSPQPESDTEGYVDYGVRPFVDAGEDNLSTFSIDVDTGSYTIARRKLREGRMPPTAAVRVEEFVNYFRQDYPSPTEGPFAVLSEAAASPFREGKTLLRVGLQGRRISAQQRKRANLVFLIDVSGSMRSSDKLGLVKQSLALLVESLRPDDVVSICTYAGGSGIALPPTPAARKDEILAALGRLRSGGGTAMASGVDLAYQLAAMQAAPGTSTRVIVCSDGDANIGRRSHGEILELIAAHRAKGVYLGTVGFGMGNYQDTMMEQLANQGDGIYAYVDDLREAERLFCEELTGTLEVIARDVKLQVAFYPQRVQRYRLLGYENRAIRDQEFRDDQVDAGEVGAGHTVTALYELELVPGSEGPLGEVRMRYKSPERPAEGEADAAREEAFSLTGAVHSRFVRASQRFRFTACVAEFAELLRKSPHVTTDLRRLRAEVEESMDPRPDEREHDLLDLVRRAETLEALQGL